MNIQYLKKKIIQNINLMYINKQSIPVIYLIIKGI